MGVYSWLSLSMLRFRVIKNRYDMKKTYLQEKQSNFRPLNEMELERTKKAMMFLYRKGISIDRIRNLNIWQIKDGNIRFNYETKYFSFVRLVPYEKTCLESQIKAVCSDLKYKKVFPKGIWKKRVPNTIYVPIFEESEVRELLNLKPKKERVKIVKKGKEKVVVSLKF